VVALLTTRDPSTTLGQIQYHAEAGSFELVAEDAIDRRHQRIRKALEFEGNVIDAKAFGFERRLDRDRSVGRGQRKREFRTGALAANRRRRSRTDGNGRGGSPGLLSE